MKATRILTGLLIGLIVSLNATAGIAQELTGKGGDAGLRFQGTVESFPPGLVGDWRVGGRTIHVSAQCELAQEIGPVAVGAFVEVVGPTLPDGSMTATKIEVKSNPAGGDGRDDLKGAIENLPADSGLLGDWRVAAHTVHVAASTIINTEHGGIALGALVEVTGTARSDGSIDAARIEVNPGAPSDGGGSSVTVKGEIESMPAGSMIGDWTVSGSRIHVTSKTKLKGYYGGGFGVGVRVKVKGIQNADGSVDASKVQFAG